MKSILTTAACAAFLTTAGGYAAVTIDTGFSRTDKQFKIGRIAPPSRNDAATAAEFSLVDGRRDGNGADLKALNDGRVPFGEDEPSRNFFFQNGDNGGRIGVDLGKVISIKSVNTYSWHPRARGPQVYKLYAAKGDEAGFQKEPKRGTDPLTCGWKAVASVDTRKKGQGGQHAVAIRDSSGGALGDYQHLLFDVETPDTNNPQANTFLSEIDVVDAKGPAPEGVQGRVVKTYEAPDKKFTYEVDSTLAPDLTGWVDKELMPVVIEWYPKIVGLLPSDGYTAHAKVALEFRDDMGGTPAYAAGNKVSMNAAWYRSQLKGEAKGSVVHELVHVVQNYWRARQTNGNPSPTPGWVTEGIADYVRWFLYEPQSKGAEITKRNFQQAKYDASYRTSANFLNWVIGAKDKDFLRKLNTAAREGKYSEQLWKDATGKSPAELGEEWKAANAKRLGL